MKFRVIRINDRLILEHLDMSVIKLMPSLISPHIYSYKYKFLFLYAAAAINNRLQLIFSEFSIMDLIH